MEKGLNYIKDLETYITIMEYNKEKIYEKYNSKKIEKIVKLDNLKLKIPKNEDNVPTESNIISISSKQNKEDKAQKKNKNIKDLINKVKLIIKFCKEKNTFLIYFTNNFWQYILNYYNKPKDDYIEICFKLRELFKEYHSLVLNIFKDKSESFTIKKEAKIYFERDEFAIILDQIIRQYNNNSEKIKENIDKLAIIIKYNPYYRESRYSNKVDCDIFDQFDLNENNEYIEFRQMNFEIIFKDSITDYIKKFMGKIKNISNFDAVMKLININNIEDKSFYLKQLRTKYDNIINNEIGLLTDEKLKEAVHIVSKIVILNYIYETEKKKFDFINEKIKMLDNKNIIPLIFIEIINICFNKEDKNDNKNEIKNIDEFENKIVMIDEEYKDKDFDKLKQFIIDEFSSKIESEENIKNILNLLDCLEKIDKKNKEDDYMINEFLQALISKNSFYKDEFFSLGINYRILLLCKLFKKYKEDKNNKINETIKNYYQKTLDNIHKDIEGNIKKSKLEEFLKNDENLVKQRLELIQIVVPSYNQNEKYSQLKTTNENINKDINYLKDIKDNIILYYKECYQDIIQRITDVVKTNQNRKIMDYKKGGIIGDLIKETEELSQISSKIKEVKNFLLFNAIYENNPRKDERKKFNESYEILKKIGDCLKDKNKNNDIIISDLNNEYKDYFKSIKEKLCNNEKDAEHFINDLKNYYNLENNELISKLDIFFKSKIYELDINSIIFFFEYKFKVDEWNEKLPPKDFVLKWEENFQNIIDDLERLNESQIYKYKDIKKYNKYNKFFRCLYKKEEAIDFLFSKSSEDIINLKNKIQPTDRTINIKDIIDTENCVFIINKMKKFESNSEIFDYIKTLDKEIE